MKLYYHVDGWHKLKPGDVISKHSYRGECLVHAIMPYADERFLNHLKKLCADGLGLHGAKFLTTNIVRSGSLANEFLLEMQFEYIRMVYNKDTVSRLQSVFACDSLEAALAFKQKYRKPESRIFEVEYSGRMFIGDLNCLVSDLNPEAQKQNALRYWHGEPFSSEKNYIPMWECLLDMPVTIVGEVEI
jgi:hypothetical protein